MRHDIQELATAIRLARIRRGLSQKELGLATGLPQSHVSRIEKGVVDAKLSTFLDLARALDLELMLIPRQQVLLAESVLGSKVQSSPGRNDAWEKSTARLIRRIRQRLATQAVSAENGKLVDQTLAELLSMVPAIPDTRQRRVLDLLREIGKVSQDPEKVSRALAELRQLSAGIMGEAPFERQPAYRLGDDE
ncbi:MAG: helix-turn-helix transcriptional regulator [Calditrichaeota bacterium]|nr:helix-turn-helix transcriptional regulator [Candidatus Cloacimonadota bacterium]MCB1047993.1 helix-turn-helix transcriptional regulator [Calditrichota bacterium]